MKRTKWIGMACLLGAQAAFCEANNGVAPTFKDVKYGAHEKELVNFWQAKSPRENKITFC